MKPRRSWLFVPGDSERKLAKTAETGADIVIVDLEDAVRPNAKTRARKLAAEWLAESRSGKSQPAHGGPQLWARINALDTPLWRDDLTAVMASGVLAGIMLPKAAGPAQVAALAGAIYTLEQRHTILTGTTQILPLVSETAAAALSVADYAQAAVPRLAGLTWGAEDLSAAIGAARKREAAGSWTDLFRLVRSTMLLTAHAAGVAAIDTLHADFRDSTGLERVARASYADGFAGMLAIHPDQVPIINAAFSLDERQLDEARAIVTAFEHEPGTGALQLDGRMIDRPHLEQAKRLLARFG